MKFQDKLKRQQNSEIWQEYCGFLDLTIQEYMRIQYRLMEEQIARWSACGLGQRLLDDHHPHTIDEFRHTLRLTTYSDYADALLQRRIELLPEEPVLWIQTTWEGGRHPVKQAPYTRGMIDVYRNNVIASLILCTSRKKGSFSVRPGDKTLYGFAPLPYATGLFPLLLEEEISLHYLPPLKEGNAMSFGQRNKEGLKQGLRQGIDLFFGMSSVVCHITENMASGSKSTNSSGGSLPCASMLLRYLKAAYRARRDGVPLRPRELFHLKGFVCAGTDASYYKDFLEEYWGICPMEIAAGTEPTIIGTETWNRNGMIFFPDACFYEFISEEEMLRNLDEPSYEPRTVLMDQLESNRNYELVISVLKGGAFARYRVGDVYRCLSTGSERDGVALPHLSFIDRVPTVIDIAGFTRITENSIDEVVKLSGLAIQSWVAAKEYNQDHRPFLHLYVEMKREALESVAISRQILAEHLSVYFKYLDSDYNDLKRLLGIEPLVVTILRSGTMEAFSRAGGVIRRINPTSLQLGELLKAQKAAVEVPRHVVNGGVARL